MLTERLQVVSGLAPAADRFNTSPVSETVNMALLERATFLVQHQGGTTGKATLTVESCSAADGTGATAVPFRYRRKTTGASAVWGDVSDALAAGIDTVPAEDTIIEIEVMDTHMLSGKPWARLKLTESVNDPVNASVIILSEPRYKGQNQPSAI